jgi:hypothetical protein
MAIDLSALFGQQPDYSQFISPDETQRMQSNASQQALLNAAISMLAQSGTQPRPVSTGQALAGALGAGMGGYNESFDRSLKQMVTGMQLAELKKKQDAQKRMQEAIRGATREVPQFGVVPTETGEMPTAETLSALTMPVAPKRTLDLAKLQESLITEGAIESPVELLKILGKDEKKETFTPLSVDQKRQLQLPVDASLQISSSGKISEIVKAPLVKNVIGGEESAFVKKSQEKLAENYVTIADSGRTARRSLSDINRLESLLEKTPTGFGASAKLAAGNIGIATKGLSELQAADALINKLVPQQRPPGSGTMSDADLELYKKSVVRIINQPGANKLIIESTKDINNYIVKEADIANQVLNGKISREEADRKFAELGNPVQDFFKKNPSIIGGSPSTKGVKFLGFE